MQIEINSKDLFTSLVNGLLVPIILKDEDIIDFLEEVGITKQKEVLNVAYWLAAGTIIELFEDADEPELKELRQMAKKLLKQASLGLPQEVTDPEEDESVDMDEILADLLDENIDEWMDTIEDAMDSGMAMEQKQEEPTVKVKPKGAKKKLIVHEDEQEEEEPEEEQEEDSDELSPELVEDFVDLQFEGLAKEMNKSKDIAALAKKYPKLDKDDIIEYVSFFVITMSISEAAKSSKNSDFAKHNEQFLVYCVQRTGGVVQKIDKLVGKKNLDKWTEDYLNVITKNLKAFLKASTSLIQSYLKKHWR